MMDETDNPPLTDEEIIRQLNEQLLSIGASSAEQSFGLAVWLGTLPILAIVAILLAFKVINIILAFLRDYYLSHLCRSNLHFSQPGSQERNSPCHPGQDYSSNPILSGFSSF